MEEKPFRFSVKNFTQNDRQTNRTLEFGMWNRRVTLRVYESKNVRNTFFDRRLDDCEVIMIEDAIAKVVNGSPEQKQSIQFQKYDFNSKQFRVEAVFTIEKDAKQIYKISLTDVAKNVTSVFTLSASKTATVGNETLNDAHFSSLKVRLLRSWLTNSRIWAPATYVPMPPRNGGGGGNGGGNYGGSSGGSRQSDDGGEQLPF